LVDPTIIEDADPKRIDRSASDIRTVEYASPGRTRQMTVPSEAMMDAVMKCRRCRSDLNPEFAQLILDHETARTGEHVSDPVIADRAEWLCGDCSQTITEATASSSRKKKNLADLAGRIRFRNGFDPKSARKLRG
jgi:hypothetical protein